MTRSIFRARAMERYHNRADKLVLPWYASPPWLLILWLASGLLLAATLMVWSVRTPIFATGPVVVVDGGPETGAAPVAAAFLPAAWGAQIQATQRAHLAFDGVAQSDEIVGQVQRVSADALSPTVARARYGLDASAGLLIPGPVVVAIIPLPVEGPDWLGSIGQARIEVGEQHGLTLLPGIGHLLAPAQSDPRWEAE